MMNKEDMAREELRKHDENTLVEFVIYLAEERKKLKEENQRLQNYADLLRTDFDERREEDKNMLASLSGVCNFQTMGAKDIMLRTAIEDLQHAMYYFQCSNEHFYKNFKEEMDAYTLHHKELADKPLSPRLKSVAVKYKKNGIKCPVRFIVHSDDHFTAFCELNGYLPYSSSDVLNYNEKAQIRALFIHRENRTRRTEDFETPNKLVEFLDAHPYYYLDYAYYTGL